MKRMAVKNAFQVLSIFYLVVTCFCSSLNVDTSIKGSLSSEGEANDSIHDSKISMNNDLPENIKIRPPSTNSGAKAASSKTAEDVKPATPEAALPASPPAKDPAEKALPPESAPGAIPPSTNLSDQGAGAESSKAPPPSAPAASSQDDSKANIPNVDAGTADESLSISKEAAASKAPADAAKKESEGTGADARVKPIASAGHIEGSDNETKPKPGEQPEDGSDVPTFDEYQKKFTAGGNGAKEGSNGASKSTGDGSSGRQDDVTMAGEAGGPGGAVASGKTGGGGSGRQQSFKNVGSQTCGSKVISHNGEASNPAYVLNENRDEYMNNPCAVKKWIVIETCEPVRLRKIEMASYELFSSMVKTFRVSSSERFPQKMWDVVGTFVANNEKGVQTYQTERDKYYKYFKFEFLDHYGNEHFCPVSLIRLFGVLMEDDDGEEETADGFGGLDPESGQGTGSEDDEAEAMVRVDKNRDPPSRSLLQSAKEVIVGIVQNTLRPSSSSKAGSGEHPSAANASTGNATGGEDNANAAPSPSNSPPVSPDGLRVMHLMRLLLSGDYSGLLQRCLELLRHAPPVVHQNFKEHRVIPSPSMAFAACAKAMANSQISSRELRWAYLAFNNDTFPWEEAGGSAAITSKLEQVPAPPPAQTAPVETSPEQEAKTEESPAPVQPISPPPLAPSSPVSAAKPAETGGPKQAAKPVEIPEAPAKERTPAGKIELPLDGHQTAEEKPRSEPSKVPKSPKEPLEVKLPVKEERQVVEKEKEQQQSQQEQPPQDEKNQPPPQQQHAPLTQTQEQSVLVAPPSGDQAVPSVKQTSPVEASKEHAIDQQLQQQPAESQQQEQQHIKHPPKVSGGEAHGSGNGRNVAIKENAYMRLSNKVKDMERNITISMGYLEELSRSYKKKTDKLSKQLEKALAALEDSRTTTEKQELRISDLEAKLKTLQEEYHGKGLSELRREHVRMRKDILVQALALNFILIVLHCLLVLLCRRWYRHSSPPAHLLALNGASGPPRSWREFPPVEEGVRMEPRPGSLLHSNSDSNLCIVDPPFRFESPLLKKDAKKKKKKKKNSTVGHPLKDRSSSESRIEQLVM